MTNEVLALKQIINSHERTIREMFDVSADVVFQLESLKHDRQRLIDALTLLTQSNPKVTHVIEAKHLLADLNKPHWSKQLCN